MERALIIAIAAVGVVWLARRIELHNISTVVGVEETSEVRIRAAEAIAAVGDGAAGEVSLAHLNSALRLAGANPSEADGERYRRSLRDAGVTARDNEDPTRASLALAGGTLTTRAFVSRR